MVPTPIKPIFMPVSFPRVVSIRQNVAYPAPVGQTMDFEWDTANISHLPKRNITPEEVEQAVLDPNAVLGRAYSVEGERREAIIGRTRDGRLLFVVYTERDGEGVVRPLHA